MLIVGLTACSRDPQVVKKRYFESGNRYFEKGRYKEASIQYRNALKRDQRYGEAHYKLGLTALKLNDYGLAVNSLRRAVELLPKESPERWDATVKLCEIYLVAVRNSPDKSLLDEFAAYTKQMLDRDPNSFDGHRLMGDLHYYRATVAYQSKDAETGKQELEAALAEYHKADAVKPDQQIVLAQLARALAARGDFPTAEQYYRRVIAKDKTVQYAYTELYRLFLFQSVLADRAKNPEQAQAFRDKGEQVIKEAFQNNPKQYAFLTMLAAHYYDERRTDAMVSVLQQIKSHAKDFDQAYVTVGDFYLRMGDGDSAIREYKEGISKDPKKKNTYNKRIIEVLMRQGKRAEAAEVNKAILKDDPNDTDARGLAATFLLDSGDVTRALTELQSVVTRDPKNPVARFNLGRAHLALGEIEQARQQFQKAIELRPDYIIARLELARLQVTRGEYDAALKTAEAVLAIDSGNVNARLVESAALMGQKKFNDSRQILDAMIKGAPSSPDVLFQLGVVNLAEGKYKEAEDAFRRSYQLNPANSRGLMGVVETNMAQNKPDEALALLQAESDKAPNRVDLLVALANTAVRAGKWDFAVQTYQRALGLMGKDPKAQGDIYLRIGETYRRKGDLPSAVQALQKARETMPQDPLVLSTLALTLDGAGRRAEARQVYEATLKIQPDNAVVLNNLAFLLAENGGDLDDALTKATRAKQLLPSLAEVSDTLGWIYLKKNLPDQAIDIFKDLVAKQPDHSTYRYHLAMAYSQKGDKSRAIEQLKEALKANPPSEEKKKIQDLIQRLG
ncbi:MAG: tetratricopeptide repeat protein [Acidobacteria bacterium]|nr:tetratricopeptide repeat protein [Acidobacteriota bacterium]